MRTVFLLRKKNATSGLIEPSEPLSEVRAFRQAQAELRGSSVLNER
jgi:hypothetical protein